MTRNNAQFWVRSLYFLVSLVTFFVILLPVTGRASNVASCSALKNTLEFMVLQLNRGFDKKTQIRWSIDKDTKSAIGNEKLSPFHAHFDREGHIRIPDLCNIAGNVPSIDLMALIVFHEYSHSLLDINTEVQGSCHSMMFDKMGIDLDKHYSKYQKKIIAWARLEHENRDLLALKLLNHFNLDASKGLAEMASYHDGNFIKKIIWKKRSKELARFLPTDFHQGRDFNKVGLFHGISKIENFLKENYPESSLVQDVSKSIDKEAGQCSFFSIEPKGSMETYSPADKEAFEEENNTIDH